MIDTVHKDIHKYYLSQIATLTVPFDYDHRQVIGEKEILFYIRCHDGVKIIYIHPTSVYPCYLEE